MFWAVELRGGRPNTLGLGRGMLKSVEALNAGMVGPVGGTI